MEPQMESQPSRVTRQAVVHDLAMLGTLYAEKAQLLLNIAAQIDTFGTPSDTETTLTPEQARSQASYATLCANFMAVAAHRLEAGECDPAFIELVQTFAAEEAVVGDPTNPAAS